MTGRPSNADLAIRPLVEFARRIVELGRRRARTSVADREIAELDLLAWARRLLPEHFRLPPSQMHIWVASQMDLARTERGLRLNVLGPRGGAKSTVVTLASALRGALDASEPYIWIISGTEQQAGSHLDNIRAELEHNGALHKAYAEACEPGRRWRSTAIELARGATIEAFGVGQQLRGRRRREHRPSLIICDDIESDVGVVNAARRDATRDWFYGVVLKAGDQRTNIVNLATALHRDALALRLHRSPGWLSRIFPAVVRWPDDMQLWHEWERIYCDPSNPGARDDALKFFESRREAMTAGAILLWPEREDLYALMRMRAEEGRPAFNREKQNQPIDPARCEWPEEYLDDDIWFNEWPARLEVRVIALDPSKGGDARHGDYSAFVLLGIDIAGIAYVEADLARRPTPQMVAEGVSLCERFRPEALGVEANQFQELLAGEFVAEFARRKLRPVPTFAIHNYVNKQVRIRRLGPHLARRGLRFYSRSPSTRLLVDQLRDFPLGSHDDGPDALEMALRLAASSGAGGAVDDGLGQRLIE